MEFTKKFKAYVLVDPNTNVPRYVGITTTSLGQRFSGHLSDIYNRPNLNKHKTAWFKQLIKSGKLPIIKQIAEFDDEFSMKQFEIDYIKQYKEEYSLINQTLGGDYVGFRAHSRESVLKKSNTRAVVQYNILGEKIAEYEIMEDISRTLNLKSKACSHITQCCKHKRKEAYGYIWRYKGEELGDISDINPNSIAFNKIVQYDLNWNRIAEYDTYIQVSKAIGDHSKGSNVYGVITGTQVSCKNYYFQLEPTYIYFDQKLFDNRLKNYTNKLSTPTKRTVLQLDLNNNILREYSSLTEAAIKCYNLRSNRKQIMECCSGKRDSWKNYKWKYKN